MWPTFYIPWQIRRYPVAARVYLTSMPYPIEVTESLQAAAALTRGYLFGTQYESFAAYGSITAGVLTVVLRTYDALHESFAGTPSIPVGELTVVLRPYDALHESFIGTPSLQSGTLVVVLITYSNWPAEGFTATPSIVAGTLT